MVRETDPKTYDKFGREEIYVGGLGDAFIGNCRDDEEEIKIFKVRPVDYEENEFVYATDYDREEEVLDKVRVCVPIETLEREGFRSEFTEEPWD
jgi:hypothetical protein